MPTGRRWTAKELDRIAELRREGCSHAQIARAMGGTLNGIQDTVYRLRRKGYECP